MYILDWKIIFQMAATVLAYIIITVILWRILKNRKMTWPVRIGLGIVFGLCAFLATVFGVDRELAVINLRDLGPLISGLFFDPFAGIIAGFLGGISRFVYGLTMHGDGYMSTACALATIVAGFVPFLSDRFVRTEGRAPFVYSLFLGALTEVFHMYIIFVLLRNRMEDAYVVVEMISPYMIFFTSCGLGLCSLARKKMNGEKVFVLGRHSYRDMSVTAKFQAFLLLVLAALFLFNMSANYSLETKGVNENAEYNLAYNLSELDLMLGDESKENEDVIMRFSGDGLYCLTDDAGNIAPEYMKPILLDETMQAIRENTDTGMAFQTVVGDNEHGLAYSVSSKSEPGYTLTGILPFPYLYEERSKSLLEKTFENILLLSFLYIAVSAIVDKLIGRSLQSVNKSLHEITEGNLSEVVNVRNSLEFSELSDDINQTVDALKGYIEAAEKRMEDELMFAATIQDAALPKNFRFSRNDFDLFALMDPAKEVGGDFYDFFFIDDNQFALVIADVSGKGIPAALFMMRAKTAIRSLAESGNEPSEIFYRANNSLCDGNDAKMFVTAWIGIIDLRTGEMKCSNAGHEFPVIKRANGKWELLKDKHGLVLAAMEDVPMKQYEMKLNPGDRLFVYTDGVPEAINEKTEQYGTDRLVKALNSLSGKTMEELLPEVRKDVSKYVGHADQFDDITMLGFTWNGPEESLKNHSAE